ncbi:hypothetical protein A2239_02695 [Candidatus Uhrbacteria bacterium RIFOXYA2_FULL_40_9]|nr:MAG: hypothetical protein A2239_02695 [Candidatus Uhrbacteria bacterium RIFOXYA2_FULL_40_9]OGL97424.1 MAG: hypothetical protein A2332_04110 [Candidatus Uhrbacteria bacterium RIFOXYB2_FULL_41_18]
MSMDDCIFCKVIKGEMPSYKVYEDDYVFAFLDIHPINPGHTILVPKTHTTDMREMDGEIAQHLMSVAQKIAPIIAKQVGTEAFNFTSNIGRAAGQVIFHTHFHIIPRFSTDGYEHWHRDGDVHEDLTELVEKIRESLE